MKSKILSLLGIAAIAFTVACNNAGDESTAEDSAGTSVDNTTSGDASASANIQTTNDGRRYVLRARTGSSSTSGANGASGSDASASGTMYDTVWVWMGTEDRYYTLGGASGKDTLYYDTENWKSWWSNPETDNELKYKSGDTKVKVDDDGSWKVKDDTSKTKMDESGKVKNKKRDN